MQVARPDKVALVDADQSGTDRLDGAIVTNCSTQVGVAAIVDHKYRAFDLGLQGGNSGNLRLD